LDKIKVGLVGTGFIATQKHLPAWQNLARRARVVAVCDVDVERGRRFAQQFNIPSVYADVQEMMNSERPDLVDVCTPPLTHKPVVINALSGGAHVLLEKPMAVNTEECTAIIEAASAAGRKVCLVHSDLFYPAFMKARELIREGQIGEFHGMRILFCTPVDYITSKPDHWANRLPGGVLGETGPHVIYLTLPFINPIREVRIQGHKLLPEFPWSPFEDYRMDLIGDKAVSSVTLSYTTKNWFAPIEIWGSDGVCKLDLETQTLAIIRRRKLESQTLVMSALSESAQALVGVASAGVSILMRRYQSTHETLFRRFLESLQDGAEAPVTAEEGREAVRVMEMLVQQLQKPKA